jgi:hypothetical protein
MLTMYDHFRATAKNPSIPLDHNQLWALGGNVEPTHDVIALTYSVLSEAFATNCQQIQLNQEKLMAVAWVLRHLEDPEIYEGFNKLIGRRHIPEADLASHLEAVEEQKDYMDTLAEDDDRYNSRLWPSAYADETQREVA